MTTAFLFPGQASQLVGMGKDLSEAYPVARQLYEEADDTLGFSLSAICFDGPMEELCKTSVTQPAVFLHSVVCARLLSEQGVEPSVVAGHSLGEYSALVAAGVLDFGAALQLVHRRGELMQAAGSQRPGAMAAILGVDDEQIVGLCEADEGVVVAANFNAPGQIVISGEADAVARVGVEANEAGAKRVMDLPVSGAFHSALMVPAADELATQLQQASFSAPRASVVTNVSATAETDPQRLQQLLIEQMTAPVRWTDSVKAVVGTGVTGAYEVGPGAVLKGLVRRIDRALEVRSMGTAQELAELGPEVTGA